MKARLAAAVMIVGILGLTGGSVLVGTTLSPSNTTSGIRHASLAARHPKTHKGVAPQTRPAHGSTSTSSPSTTTATTSIPTTQPTTFVVTGISYAVKAGDTVSTIARWFQQHGYGAQFAANLQVIELHQNLLVPGAIVTISSGVMTIQSPA